MGESPTPAILSLQAVRHGYGGLRPLRVADLRLAARERLSVFGLDATAAEVFVNLVTGASLPEEGRIEAFGRPTSAIAGGEEWFEGLDRFGLVSHRVVLLEEMTVAQNLAVPFTLAIDPLEEAARAPVERLAGEVGLGAGLERRVAELTPGDRLRLCLGRALATGPSLVILEHASASLSPRDARRCARLVSALGGARGFAVLALTADRAFARALGGRRVTLRPASGALVPSSWWPWRP